MARLRLGVNALPPVGVGERGRVVVALSPSGTVRVGAKDYAARVAAGSLDAGVEVVVLDVEPRGLVVAPSSETTAEAVEAARARFLGRHGTKPPGLPDHVRWIVGLTLVGVAVGCLVSGYRPGWKQVSLESALPTIGFWAACGALAGALADVLQAVVGLAPGLSLALAVAGTVGGYQTAGLFFGDERTLLSVLWLAAGCTGSLAILAVGAFALKERFN
jgi:hypothetical protein